MHFAPQDSFDTVTLISYPGGGKGEAVKTMTQIYHDRQLFESGEAIRNEVANQSNIGKRAQEYIYRGELIPDEDMFLIVRDSIRMMKRKALWILDGFPRKEEQLPFYNDLMCEHERADVAFYLQLSCDPQVAREIARERMTLRGKAAIAAGKKPRKDDIDHDAREKRLDQAEWLIPVIQHFEDQGKYIVIDASKPLLDVRKDVYARVMELIDLGRYEKNGAVDRD